eukprot:1489982-Prymnesium_polylepis.1
MRLGDLGNVDHVHLLHLPQLLLRRRLLLRPRLLHGRLLRRLVLGESLRLLALGVHEPLVLRLRLLQLALQLRHAHGGLVEGRQLLARRVVGEQPPQLAALLLDQPRDREEDVRRFPSRRRRLLASLALREAEVRAQAAHVEVGALARPIPLVHRRADRLELGFAADRLVSVGEDRIDGGQDVALGLPLDGDRAGRPEGRLVLEDARRP